MFLYEGVIMHIAIKGMDSVEKTTTANLLAERLNFQFIQKPLHLSLFNPMAKL